MDIAGIDLPAHIGVRDAMTGRGNRCLLVECGGANIDAGLAAFRAAYPHSTVFADRDAAIDALRKE